MSTDLTPGRLAELRQVAEQIPPLDSKWPDAAYIRLAVHFTRETCIGVVDEITRLRAENDALAAALEPFVRGYAYRAVISELWGSWKDNFEFRGEYCRVAADALAKRDAKRNA